MRWGGERKKAGAWEMGVGAVGVEGRSWGGRALISCMAVVKGGLRLG